MEAVTKNGLFNESWFSGFRTVIEKSFIKVNYKVNAVVILQKIKTLDIDKDKIVLKIKNLSEDEWSYKYLVSTLKELDEIMKISDDFLRKHAVQELQGRDLTEVKWEIMKGMLTDYAKFTKEFYDSLKYSQNSKLGRKRYLLMIELMNALKKIYDASKQLIDKFSQKKYNKTSFKKFMSTRIALEHLLLRVFYILLNIDKEENFIKYRDVLSREIIEYTVRQAK